jgi:hypothetical protein
LEKTDLPSVARAHLESLKTTLNAAIAKSADKNTRYHLQDVSQRIRQALDPK